MVGDGTGGQKRCSADIARYAQRQDDPQKSLQVVLLQIPGCRYDVPVDLGKYIVDQQHQNGQEIVYHARMIANGVLISASSRKRWKKRRTILMASVFFQQVCHAVSAQQKIHHMGRNEDQYNETGLIDIFSDRIMASG